jgi:hypothetical protein
MTSSSSKILEQLAEDIYKKIENARKAVVPPLADSWDGSLDEYKTDERNSKVDALFARVEKMRDENIARFGGTSDLLPLQGMRAEVRTEGMACFLTAVDDLARRTSSLLECVEKWTAADAVYLVELAEAGVAARKFENALLPCAIFVERNYGDAGFMNPFNARCNRAIDMIALISALRNVEKKKESTTLRPYRIIELEPLEGVRPLIWDIYRDLCAQLEITSSVPEHSVHSGKVVIEQRTLYPTALRATTLSRSLGARSRDEFLRARNEEPTSTVLTSAELTTSRWPLDFYAMFYSVLNSQTVWTHKIETTICFKIKASGRKIHVSTPLIANFRDAGEGPAVLEYLRSLILGDRRAWTADFEETSEARDKVRKYLSFFLVTKALV